MAKFKSNRIVSVLAAALMMTAFPLQAFAAEAEPLSTGFNKNDVNGVINVSVSESSSAQVDITFDSPEGKDIPYYSFTVEGGKTVPFELEGRDNSIADYRFYNIKITVKYGGYSAVFTDTLNGVSKDSVLIPDPDKHPDSYVKYNYTFNVDRKPSAKPVEVVSSDASGKNVGIHFVPVYIKGDANIDGLVNMADAVLIMQSISNADEYGRGKENGITPQGELNADVVGDDGVTMLDAQQIQDFSLGLITKL